MNTETPYRQGCEDYYHGVPRHRNPYVGQKVSFWNFFFDPRIHAKIEEKKADWFAGWDAEAKNSPRAKFNKRDGAIAVLERIASMPEYDQDDAHRLRGLAKSFLANTKMSEPLASSRTP